MMIRPFQRIIVFILFITCPFAVSYSTTSGSSFANKLIPSTCATACVDCAIIGGGPAGLIASIALSKASPSSSIAIFEKDNFEPKGASVQISPKGWKCIEKIDPRLATKLKTTGVPVISVEVKPWKYQQELLGDGKEKKRARLLKAVKKQMEKVSKMTINTLFKAVVQRVHRWHDVRMTLKDYSVELYNGNKNVGEDKKDEVELPPFLNTNCVLVDCVQIHEEKKGTKQRFELTFKSTASSETFMVTSKYLFACDGTKSVVREILPNEPDVLLAENKSVWRGMAPNINARGKATFYRGAATSDGTDNTTGRSALIFPGGKDAGSSWSVISDVIDRKSESLQEAKERVLKVLETMNTGTEENPEYAVWQKLIQDTDVVIENKLHVRDFTQPWESAYDGLVYFGDAAHPVRPTGEGLALAFEDAEVLSDVLMKQSENENVSVDSLREYEKERYVPVKTISEKIRTGANSFYKASEQVVR